MMWVYIKLLFRRLWTLNNISPSNMQKNMTNIDNGDSPSRELNHSHSFFSSFLSSTFTFASSSFFDDFFMWISCCCLKNSRRSLCSSPNIKNPPRSTHTNFFWRFNKLICVMMPASCAGNFFERESEREKRVSKSFHKFQFLLDSCSWHVLHLCVLRLYRRQQIW